MPPTQLDRRDAPATRSGGAADPQRGGPGGLLEFPAQLVRAQLRLLRLPLHVVQNLTNTVMRRDTNVDRDQKATSTRPKAPAAARPGARTDNRNPDEQEARRGLKDSVAGKAKEVVGAVLGKDRLLAEGQLQQEEAADRREAAARKALAEQERKQANAEAARRRERLTEERAEVARDTARTTGAIERERAEAKRTVDQVTDRRKASATAQARTKAARVEQEEVAAERARAGRLTEAAREEQAAQEAKAEARRLEEVRKEIRESDSQS